MFYNHHKVCHRLKSYNGTGHTKVPTQLNYSKIYSIAKNIIIALAQKMTF